MKYLFIVAILMFTVSALSFGQPASVTATVNSVITVTNTHDLVFGNVTKGTAKTVLSTDANAAAFSVAAEANTLTTLTVVFPGNLSDGANTLPFTGLTPVYNTTNSQSGTTVYGALTGGNATTNGSGNLYFWMGGVVNPAVGQVSGNYTGTINVTVAYP